MTKRPSLLRLALLRERAGFILNHQSQLLNYPAEVKVLFVIGYPRLGSGYLTGFRLQTPCEDERLANQPAPSVPLTVVASYIPTSVEYSLVFVSLFSYGFGGPILAPGTSFPEEPAGGRDMELRASFVSVHLTVVFLCGFFASVLFLTNIF